MKSPLPSLHPLAAAIAAAFALAAQAQTGPLPVLQPGGVYTGANLPSVTGTRMTIQQTAPRATLEWNTFNIAPGHAVQFVQPNSSSVALNRVLGNERTVIQGLLQANGQVYILNNNGILFDRGSQVNVHTLLASSLNMNEVVFSDLGTTETRSFFLTGDKELRTSALSPRQPHFQTHAAGSGEVILRGAIQASGGPVLVFGPKITNEGSIRAPDGQVVLAAGDRVWLARPSDTETSLRGYLVEFRADAATNLANVLDRSSVTNTGSISADRGNVTLAALAVNQAGRATAASAAYLNGSVYLVAAEGLGDGSGGRRSGSVTLAAGSVTGTPLDATDRSTVAESENYAPYRSVIALSGSQVDIKGEVRAPGGVIQINRQADDGAGSLDGRPARVLIDSGALVSAAGAWVDVAADHSVATIQVTSNELKDSPLLKGGALQGETLRVDLRRGTSLFDTTAFRDGQQRSVFEKAGAGGEIAIRTTGDLIVRPGAVLDVSGGGTRYAAGQVVTSQVSAAGQNYDVTTASPDLRYERVADSYTVRYGRWRTETFTSPQSRGTYQAADVEGRAGGTLSISAPGGAVIEGSVQGSVTAGRLQLDKGKLPQGAKFTAGTPFNPQVPNYSLTTVDLSQRGTLLPEGAFSGALPAELAGRLTLPADFFRTGESRVGEVRQHGFGTVEVYANESIVLPAGQTIGMPAGGSIALTSRSVAVDGSIVAPAGSIKLAGLDVGTPGADPSVRLGAGGRLDARGLWVNDSTTALAANGGLSAPRLIDGGTVTLEALDLSTGAGSLIDVSSGGRLSGASTLTGGNAGSVVLRAQSNIAGTGVVIGTPQLDGALRAYGFGAPGSLTLTARNLCIGTASCGLTDEFRFAPERFGADGFGRYTLASFGDVIVQAGAQVRPQLQALAIGGGGAAQFATGADIYAFAAPAQPTSDLRRAAGISISAGNLLEVRAGAAIVTEASSVSGAQGSVTLSASERLQVHGRIEAPGGAISLALGSASDPAGNPDALLLGPAAVLSTAGAYVPRLGAAPGERAGEVLRGGSVSLSASGAPMTLAAGSLVDVSGAQATLDLRSNAAGQLTATRVTSDAGSIAISGSELTRIEGTLTGRAQGASAGGALSVQMTYNPALGEPGPPLPERRILVANDLAALPALAPSPALGSAAPREARLAVGQLGAQGFDKLRLATPDRILFHGDVSLSLGRALRLDAPSVGIDAGATVALSAPRIELASGLASALAAPSNAGGAGTLSISAGSVLDVIGQVGFNNVGTLNLSSGGDLRLTSLFVDSSDTDTAPDTWWGSLRSAGDINLTAAQVYPTTYSKFRIESPTRIHVAKSGNAPGYALSAGGELTLAAPAIEQDGVLKAPLGRIDLDATGGSLTLMPGSLTSVSAGGLSIPFGGTSGGVAWSYLGATINTPPDKRISLRGATVDAQAGSQIDVAGGGELLGVEFLAGPGGSADFLARSDVYAILPQGSLTAAPRDGAIPNAGSFGFGSDRNVYDSVYLAGAPGLAAGNYTLLPGYYALLPGAWIVRPQTSRAYQDYRPGQSGLLADGSNVIAGYRTVSGTGLGESRWSGFALSRPVFSRPGVLPQSEYVLRGSEFFTERALTQDLALPRVAADAGRVSFAATGTLALGGTIDAGSAAGRGEIEITSGNRDIVIAGSGSQALQSSYAGYAPGAFLRLDASRLSALDARLVIGGSRTDGSNALAVTAPNVILDNPAALGGGALAGPEVILAGTQRVILAADSRLAGSGTFSGQASDISVSGAGALVRVSSGPQVGFSRPGLALPAAQGSLSILAGASVSGASIILDATNSTALGGSLDFGGARGALDIGAPAIGLGEVAGVPGLAFSNAQLGAFANLEQLRLRSYSTIDMYGNTALGGSGLGSVTLSGAGLGGRAVTDAAGTREANAVIRADSVRFENPTTSTFNTALAGAGLLDVGAREITIGAGTSNLRGFASVNLAARETARGVGAGTLGVFGALDLKAARITGASGADTRIVGSGTVLLGTPADAVLPATALEAGGRLEISGASLVQGSRIELPGGVLKLTATTGDLTLAAGSYTGAPGFARDFGGATGYASGGSVSLTSTAGNVNVLAGASVDLSAPGGRDAGDLNVSASAAGRQFSVAGTLSGGSTSTARGGAFNLDAGTAGGFSGYNAALNAGGFDRSRSVRVRGGDLTVGAGDTVRAREVKLVAEAGALRIDGTIDASSAPGNGRIELYSSGTLTLANGSRLLAKGVGSGAGASDPYSDGGLVRLESRSGAGGVRLNFQSGAEIDVSAGAKGDAGRIEFITSRTPTTHAALNGKVIGNAGAAGRGGEVIVYGNEITTVAGAAGSTVTLATNQTNPAYASYNSFATGTTLTNAQTAFRGSLQTEGIASGSITVRPAVELQSAANLTINTAWDLTQTGTNGWYRSSIPGLLTIRSDGNIDIQASLGFVAPSATAFETLPTTDTWSIQLAGGANRASVDRGALQARTFDAAGNDTTPSGDVRLTSTSATATSANFGANVRVRTGTGDIEIAARRDFAIATTTASSNYVNAVRSAVYTTGVPAFADTGTGGAFAERGGDVRIAAQRDAQGLDPTAPGLTAATQPYIGDWLRRSSNVSFTTPPVASWWVYRPTFTGIGSFGGGNLAVSAGRNVNHLPVAVATSGRATAGTPETLVVRGGGTLEVQAGGDLRGGTYLVAGGSGRIGAGDSVGATTRTAFYLMGEHNDPARGIAALQVEAGRDIRVQNLSNPTILPASTVAGVANSVQGFQTNRTQFFTYGAADSASFTAVNGDLSIAGTALPTRSGSLFTTLFNVAPPQLELTSLAGNVYGALTSTVAGQVNLLPPGSQPHRLFPGDAQRLTVLAGRDIHNLQFDAGDAPLGGLPVWSAPQLRQNEQAASVSLAGNVEQLIYAPLGAPRYVLAAGRDIFDLQAGFAGAASVRAGRDLDTIRLDLQNTGPQEVSSVYAGRDLRQDLAYRTGPLVAGLNGTGTNIAKDQVYIRVGGPGRLLVQTGRSLDLGSSAGIAAIGSAANPSLSSGSSAAVTGVVGYTGAVDFTGIDGMFDKLIEAGKARDPAAGDAAVAAVFDPAKVNTLGNLTMYNSSIVTDGGSGIDLVVLAGTPGSRIGGNINAGLPTGSATDTGIITRFGGSIRSFTQNEFAVNASKVVTQLGGDIVAYSAQAGIDAGRGARTSVSSAAVRFEQTDANGDGVRDLFSERFLRPPLASVGSGIRTNSFDPDGSGPLSAPRPGDIFLFAPRGTINAGEAGVSSAGNVFVVALQVVNAQNISAGGTSTGVPVVASGGVGASASGASASASSAIQSATEGLRAPQPPAFKPSFISVEVIGYGE